MPKTYYEVDGINLDASKKRERSNKKAELNFKLLPNPASSFCWLIHEGLGAGLATIELISLDGIKVLEQKNANRYTYVDLSNTNTGAYLIRLTQEGRVLYVNKLIIVK